MAARVRNALKTLANFHDVDAFHSCTWANDERVLSAHAQPWINSSCFRLMKNVIQHFEQTGTKMRTLLEHSTKTSFQRMLTQKLLSEDTFSPEAFFKKRLARFFNDSSYIQKIPSMLDHYRVFGRKFKVNFLTSHLRLCCNQWCTSRRFGLVDRGCPFGCHEGPDAIEHCITCEEFQAAFMQVLRCKDMRFNIYNLLFFDVGDLPIPQAMCGIILLYVHTAYLAYNMCRHGQRLSARTITFILKKASKHCLKMRCFIIKCRRFGLGGWSGGLDGASMAGVLRDRV